MFIILKISLRVKMSDFKVEFKKLNIKMDKTGSSSIPK